MHHNDRRERARHDQRRQRRCERLGEARGLERSARVRHLFRARSHPRRGRREAQGGIRQDPPSRRGLQDLDFRRRTVRPAGSGEQQDPANAAQGGQGRRRNWQADSACGELRAVRRRRRSRHLYPPLPGRGGREHVDHQRARRAHLADGFGGGVLLFEGGRSARGLRPRFRAGSLLGFRRLPWMGRSDRPDFRGRAPERHRNRFEDRLRDGVTRRRLHLHREGRRQRLHP